jgi:hypothetical protein
LSLPCVLVVILLSSWWLWRHPACMHAVQCEINQSVHIWVGVSCQGDLLAYVRQTPELSP